MDAERWNRLKELLAKAREQPDDEQSAFLDTTCDDLELRHEAQSILDFDHKKAFLDFPLFEGKHRDVHLHEAEHDEAEHEETTHDGITVGQRIGVYEVVRLLGRGGMGAVFLAQRQDDYRQQVAIKVIRGGMDGRSASESFQKERQILADLKHPHIASLLDGGSLDDGRLFLVMEYVDGEPIDKYCQQQKLSLKERLALFCQVCDAVHLAHQKLVVHRDIKPGNILVEQDTGHAKLLDFGIAKVMESDPAHADDLTLPGQRPLTLRYASPEQIRGDLITTASDTYSLGVVLYLLLTDRLPDALDDGLGPFNARQSVDYLLDYEPTPPSQAVLDPSATSPDGDSSLARSRRLRGDLDAIALKALRKEPEQRYGSAYELAADVHRYFDGLPVKALQGSWTYRLKKSMRRYRTALAIAAILLISAVTTTVLWRQAVAEQRRASNYLAALRESLKSLDPQRPRLPDPDNLAPKRDRPFDEPLQDEPRLRADLMALQAIVYRNLGHPEVARRLLEDAVSILTQHPQLPHDEELAEAHSNLGTLCYDLHDMECFERNILKSVEIRQALGQDQQVESVKSLNNLASLHLMRGEYSEAESLYREGLETRLAVQGPEHLNVATSRRHLGSLYFLRGDAELAEPLLREALASRRSQLDENHPQVASAKVKLAEILQEVAKGDASETLRHEADSLFLDALASQTERLGFEHPNVVQSRLLLASFLLESTTALSVSEHTTVRLLLQDTLSATQTDAEDNWRLALAESLLGDQLARLGFEDEALTCLDHGHDILLRSRGEAAIYTRRAGARLVDWTRQR